MAVRPDIRIMVVDDFSPMRHLLVESLKMLKFSNIEEAENGFVALDKLRAHPFDLVISDWSMPEMDGMELLGAMRSDEQLKTIPVLMVTAESSPDNIMKAVKAGVSNYIVKPIKVRTLMEKIDQVINA